MNILFFVEPWIERAIPHWHSTWVQGILSPMNHRIRQFKEFNCYYLIGDAQIPAAARHFRGSEGKTGVIHQKELRQIFPDCLAASLAWYNNTYTKDQLVQMVALVQSKMNKFIPDIILAFSTNVPFLRKLYPKALILHIDYACFSRPPYPVDFFFDPCGLLKNSTMVKYYKQISEKPLTRTEKLFLHFFRKKYIDRLIKSKNPFTREELLNGKNFKHLILLPLQVGGTFAFEGNCPFATQWDLLCHVMDNVRPDIGVIVTEHSDWHRLFTPEALSYLRATYPNFLYCEELNQYECVSQFLLQFVDGVAAVSTSVALQALLWEKPVCALGASHINTFAVTDDISKFGGYLDQGIVPDNESLLYFLLARFNVPAYVPYLWESSWFEQRLTMWLEHYRKHGSDENFLSPIDEPFKLLKFYLRMANANIPCESTGQSKI